MFDNININSLMKRVAFLIISLVFYTSASATDTLLLKAYIYKAAPNYSILTDNNYTYEQAAVNFSNVSLLEKKVRGKLQRSLYDYWTGIYLRNNSADTILLVAEAYIKEAWLDNSKVIVCGDKPCSKEPFPLQDKYTDVALIAVPPGIHFFVAKISDYNLPVYFAPILSEANIIESKFYLSEIYKISLLAIILGVFLIVAVISMALYFITKDKALLWYALYCFAIILSTYLSLQSTYSAFYWSFEYVPWVYTKMFVRIILLVAYAKFAQHFIVAKIKMPQLNRLINIYIYVCIASLLPDIVLLLAGMLKESYVYYFIARIVLTIGGVIIISSLWKYRKDKYVQFILAGSTFLILGEVASNIVAKKYSPQVAGLGAFIEIIIFTFGVAYRVYTYYKQKNKLVKDLLQKEKEAAELFSENSGLNISVFQSQMNPHFIFNSLNSIKELILTNKNEEASRYLSKFGHLVRLNLDQNSKSFISIRDNNALLKAYLEMESLRFTDFEWEIKVEESIDDEDMLMPPMLVQPFVENAIWHGLLPKLGYKKIEINYSVSNEKLLCNIIDNGIGINTSLQIKKDTSHHSIGLKNITERIKLLKQKYNKDFDIAIKDKKNIGALDSGTIATIVLPILNKNQYYDTP